VHHLSALEALAHITPDPHMNTNSHLLLLTGVEIQKPEL
jgi:hypothetical protein